jgi:hypothetical protein
MLLIPLLFTKSVCPFPLVLTLPFRNHPIFLSTPEGSSAGGIRAFFYKTYIGSLCSSLSPSGPWKEDSLTQQVVYSTKWLLSFPARTRVSKFSGKGQIFRALKAKKTQLCCNMKRQRN